MDVFSVGLFVVFHIKRLEKHCFPRIASPTGAAMIPLTHSSPPTQRAYTPAFHRNRLADIIGCAALSYTGEQKHCNNQLERLFHFLSFGYIITLSILYY